MRKRTGMRLLVPAVLVPLVGCAHTAITASGSRQAQVIHGSVGIIGEDIELTILAGSDVTKLSMMGEDIQVVVEDGAVVRKVEIVGEDNEVSCPTDLTVEYSEIGEGNRLIRRP